MLWCWNVCKKQRVGAFRPLNLPVHSQFFGWWSGQRWIENRRYFKAVSVEIATKQCPSFAPPDWPPRPTLLSRNKFPVNNSHCRTIFVRTSRIQSWGVRDLHLWRPSICHYSEYLACMPSEHILSVKYLCGPITTFQHYRQNRSSATKSSGRSARVGKTRQRGELLMRSAHFYCYHLVAGFCCAVKAGWSSVDQHQMSVALALNRLKQCLKFPQLSASFFMNIFCPDPENAESNLLIWQW